MGRIGTGMVGTGLVGIEAGAEARVGIGTDIMGRIGTGMVGTGLVGAAAGAGVQMGGGSSEAGSGEVGILGSCNVVYHDVEPLVFLKASCGLQPSSLKGVCCLTNVVRVCKGI
jgi:hypothetical protein